MPKPAYITNNEAKARRYLQLKRCCQCDHFGKPVSETRHKGKELCAVHQCIKHPEVLNTEYSFACGDWSCDSL